MTSIVIPTLNEAAAIERTLRAARDVGWEKEIIVADGGSEDGTAEIAERCGAKVIRCGRGRGVQMRAGAAAARGDVLWFLHADTTAPVDAIRAIDRALSDPGVVGGNFSLLFEGSTRAARHLTWTYPKLRALGLSYGDAGIFVRRETYEAIGGFRPIALFEDVDLIRRLRKAGRFVHLDCRLTTSSRRFEGRNYARVWALWIALQVCYWAGVSPDRLARWYKHAR